MLFNDELYRFAATLVDQAAKISCKYFRQPLVVEAKDGNFPVTIADREIETNLRQMISEHYPSHGVIGEEFDNKISTSEYIWVIDPIDGTVAFTTGKPTYTTLVALLKDDVPILGIIDQPVQHERFVGIKGRGAWLNQQPILANKIKNLDVARLNATTPYMFNATEMQKFEQVRQHVKVCSWGGDAYAYGLLASGHIDIIMESELQYYDVAALEPIISASGGVITDWQGMPITRKFNGQCLASCNQIIHQQVLSLIK